jgi:hypothetical protein
VLIQSFAEKLEGIWDAVAVSNTGEKEELRWRKRSKTIMSAVYTVGITGEEEKGREGVIIVLMSIRACSFNKGEPFICYNRKWRNIRVMHGIQCRKM